MIRGNNDESEIIHQMRDSFMHWPQVDGLDEICSPALLVDPDRVATNVDRMIDIIGGPASVSRLRPHVKTHKMPDAIRVQLDKGIRQFKTATLAESEMVASAGADDVLLAHQMVGPKIDRLASMMQEFPETQFSTIVDDCDVVVAIANRMNRANRSIRLYIDIDCGMHRTGAALGDQVDRVKRQIESTNCVVFGGLHVYDGHIHDASMESRRDKVAPIIDAVDQYVSRNDVPVVVAGGTPTYPMWANQTLWQCSPGTPILWDIGYGGDYEDLPFDVAAVLLTRIISKPASGLLCFDVGHKSISAEMPVQQRLVISGINDATIVGQSEEHLVVSTSQADNFSVGDPFLAFPRHICPTVALYPEAYLVQNGKVTGDRWLITARDH
tara:strand:- start:110479 stop:111627 length:1149 start_codon:yes stop_codon:yes gene_type:complete